MKGKTVMNEKKLLNSQKEIPLLGQEEIKNLVFEFEANRRRKYSIWRKIYAVTVGALIAVVIALLIIGMKVDAALFSQDYFDGIYELFWGRGYHNSWGGGPSDSPGNTTQTPSDKEDLPTGIVPPDNNIQEDVTPPASGIQGLYEYDYSKVPNGHTPIVPMDLSLYKNGDLYINNSTGYKPDIEGLLNSSLSSPTVDYLSSTNAPTVLIVHTHGTEAYSSDGAISYEDNGSEIARSDDIRQNVVSVGAVMAEILNEKGISTLHCTVMHDSIQYKDSYSRAEETIKQYMEKYPSIKLVIDLHRDSIVKSSGELVRPVTLVDGNAAAQIMCVVGSDWGGGYCPNWQDNLSLALKLRQRLNAKYTNICRPTDLRSQSFNQELAPYSLLLEIGSSGNSRKEAMICAALVANELAELILQI